MYSVLVECLQKFELLRLGRRLGPWLRLGLGSRRRINGIVTRLSVQTTLGRKSTSTTQALHEQLLVDLDTEVTKTTVVERNQTGVRVPQNLAAVAVVVMPAHSVYLDGDRDVLGLMTALASLLDLRRPGSF